ncbi:class I SAM-dependent methyltransferase [Mycobacterium sp. PS03-16]|uniref:class I SAM-dependent methyltransferase n=1 Tax=Mycobacterium sp. PS03-16 TaxID=2559611 RepID=UPI001072F76F|nr:class I SAM-dependent methyltransferase [Mycobacterium sp. PS03-16]TFV59165.1 class I SAM-dependent methyltransferase [Mycobacterium sp. PS03-16]
MGAHERDTLTAEWDERYKGWDLSGAQPNAVLIAETAGLTAGRALDIGCGLGAEAIWLAQQGWRVTAMDVSQVALDRAAQRAQDAGVQVQWCRGSLEDAELPSDGFDLVTAHYPALRHSAGGDAQKALLGAVGPGGTLLVVHHADVDEATAKAHGFDPADYLMHDDVVALLGDGWEVRVQRRRPRATPAGAQGQHTHDDVVVARRR